MGIMNFPIIIGKPNMLRWRLNKKVGCEKSYDGWNFFSTSVNSNGYDLYEKIKNECKDFKLLLVTERQL